MSSILDPDKDPRVEQLRELVKFREDMARPIRDDLVKTLDLVAERLRGFADQLAGRSGRKKLTTRAGS